MKRSERIAAITALLLSRPYELYRLSDFAGRFDSAKSTISEDLSIIAGTFAREGIGSVETVPGPGGGVRFVPWVPVAEKERIIRDFCQKLSDPNRILPGGYLYVSDLACSPEVLFKIGEIFAHTFASARPESVVTIETLGIPVALMTARALGVPLHVVRRVSKVTEGTAVSINYVSGSYKRIETMSLSRRSLTEGSRVLVIDDFMKAGGTARGILDLMREFGAEVCGIGVLIETAHPREKLVKNYQSLVVLEEVDERNRVVRVRPSRLG